LDNMQQFPNCLQTPDAMHSMSESSTADDSSLTTATNDNASANYGTSPPVEPEFPSFASMLREGKAKPVVTSNTNTVIGNQLAANESEDEYQRPTAYNYSLSDAFAAALQLKSSGPQTDGNKKGSKKKKTKPKLLMSTGMNRMY